MPNPTLLSYLGVPGWALLWVVALVALLLFGRRVLRIVTVLRRARVEIRWDRIPQRLVYAATNVLGQPRLLQEPVIGVAHLLIFWAFVFFATGFWWNLAKGMLPFVPVPYADELPWMSFPMEAFGVLALVSIVVAAGRRYIFTPPRLERTRDATIVLSLITALLVTFLVAQGAKAASGGEVGWGSPAGAVLGRAFLGLGLQPAGAPGLFVGFWWAHMVIVLGFLAYLPYSKHAHLLFSPFSALFTSFRPGAMPAESEGAADLEQFTWRQLFNALSCAECGRCDRACPAHNSGFPLSPKDLVHHFKEMMAGALAAPAARAAIPAAAATAAPSAAPSAPAAAVCAPGAKEAASPAFLGSVVKPEELWSCTTCMACMRRCPVFNEHIPLVVEMRRHLVSQGEMEKGVQDVLVNLGRYGNSFGKSARARAGWTNGLGFTVKDARKEPVEYLWIVGDYASFDPRAQSVTKAAARVFQRAGLDFGILYEAEQNAGNDVRRIGEEGLFGALREKNLKAFEKARFKKIVTTDPHTYHVLKNEYAETGGSNGLHGVEVLHFSEVVDGLIRDGKLPIVKPLDVAATYHDPCYLGRYNGVYDAPRRVLKALGVRLKEMGRNRDGAYCCGAGGGRIWMEDVPGIKERPAESRIREAAGLGGTGTFVVNCPKDLVMFQDALKTAGLEGTLVVKDLAELVDSAGATAVRSDSNVQA